MARRYRYKEVQLVQLRSFCLVATNGNFTRAAKTLGLSASTVWEQVRALEQRLSTTLLQQRGRTVELTPEGRVLLELVRPHVDGLDSLERLFEQRRSQIPQSLNVASSQYLLRFHLPRAIQQFTAAHPSIHLNVKVPAEPQNVLEAVERGEVDVAVFPCDPSEPRGANLECEHLFDLPLSLMARSRHPLARRKRVGLHDLVSYPMILPARDSYTRRVIDRVLLRENLTGSLHIVMETMIFDTIHKYASLGMGIALMHMTCGADQGLTGSCMRVLEPALEPLPIMLVVRKFAHHSAPVEAFRNIVRQSLSQPASARP